MTMYGKNDKMDKKVLEYQDGKLADKMRKDEDEDSKSQVFDSAVMDPVCAARELYMDGKTLDYVLGELISWFKKCKGKEAELLKELEEDEDED